MNEQHVIDLEITNYCQAACSSCPRTDITDIDNPIAKHWLKLQHTSYSKIAQRLDIIDNYYSNTLIDVTVKLCGEWGDPAMHPDLADIVQYAANKMHIDSVIINTNGGLRSAAFWTSLYHNTTDSNASVNVMWGIDGSTHYYNDMYRRNVNTARAFENMHAWFNVSNDNGMWQYLAFTWNHNDWESAYNYAVMHNIPFKFAIGHVVDQAQQLTDTQLVTARKYVTLANNQNTV